MNCTHCGKIRFGSVSTPPEMSIDMYCVCPPAKIGELRIPKNPKCNGDYTLRMLSGMYLEQYIKGNREACLDLFTTMSKLSKVIDYSQYRGEVSIATRVGFDEDKYHNKQLDL